MTHCVGCHEVIDPTYWFCPSCGTDNRPPESRPAIPKHLHVFGSVTAGYCVVCGAKHASDRIERHWPTVFAGAVMVPAGLVEGGLTVADLVAVRTGRGLQWVYNLHHGVQVPARQLIHESYASGIVALILLIAGGICLVQGWRGYDMTTKDSFTFWSR